MGDGFLGKCKECAKEDSRGRGKEKQADIREYDKLRYRTDIARLKGHKYRGIKNRCEGGHKNRIYFVEGLKYLTADEYDVWWENNIQDFEHCYGVWVEPGFKNKFAPSIDRIDNTKGYVADNMQWLTFSVNCSKHTK
jgi:hypothetical protein